MRGETGFTRQQWEWRQQASGRETSTHDSATSCRVFCPAKCGTQIDVRIKPIRQQTGWPVVVCHKCSSENSTRSVICVRCRTVAHRYTCSATSAFTAFLSQAGTGYNASSTKLTRNNNRLTPASPPRITHSVPDATEVVTPNQEQNGLRARTARSSSEYDDDRSRAKRTSVTLSTNRARRKLLSTREETCFYQAFCEVPQRRTEWIPSRGCFTNLYVDFLGNPASSTRWSTD